MDMLMMVRHSCNATFAYFRIRLQPISVHKVPEITELANRTSP